MSTQELAAALCAAQSLFSTVAKNKTANAGTYKYSYSDLSAIMDMIRKPLTDNGLAVTHQIRHISLGERTRTVLQTVLLHESGGSLVSEVELFSEGAKFQDFGIELSYKRRYALIALLGIATDDEDTETDGRTSKTRAPDPPPRKKAPRKAAARKPNPKAAAERRPDPLQVAEEVADEADGRLDDHNSQSARASLFGQLRQAGEKLGKDEAETHSWMRDMLKEKFDLESTKDLTGQQMNQLKVLIAKATEEP